MKYQRSAKQHTQQVHTWSQHAKQACSDHQTALCNGLTHAAPLQNFMSTSGQVQISPLSSSGAAKYRDLQRLQIGLKKFDNPKSIILMFPVCNEDALNLEIYAWYISALWAKGKRWSGHLNKRHYYDGNNPAHSQSALWISNPLSQSAVTDNMYSSGPHWHIQTPCSDVGGCSFHAYHRCRDDGGVWRELLCEWYDFPLRHFESLFSNSLAKGPWQMGWLLVCAIRDACLQP